MTDDYGELTQSSDQEFVVGDVNRWLPLTQCVRLELKNEFSAEFVVARGTTMVESVDAQSAPPN